MGKGTNKQKKQANKNISPSKYQDSEARQGRRFLFVWIPIIVVVVVFFYAFMFDPQKPVGQPVPGTLREGEQSPSGEAIGKTYMVVLDDGRMVKLDGLQMGSLKVGRRLLIQENVTPIFKRKSFVFVRYIE